MLSNGTGGRALTSDLQDPSLPLKGAQGKLGCERAEVRSLLCLKNILGEEQRGAEAPGLHPIRAKLIKKGHTW